MDAEHLKPLTKQDILSHLSFFDSFRDQIMIEFKGALVLYGMCDTCRDLDISCTPQLMQQLSLTYTPSGSSKFNHSDRIPINEYVECFGSDDITEGNFIHINGYKVRNLSGIYAMYQTLARPKDFDTMDLIEDFRFSDEFASSSISDELRNHIEHEYNEIFRLKRARAMGTLIRKPQVSLSDIESFPAYGQQSVNSIFLSIS